MARKRDILTPVLAGGYQFSGKGAGLVYRKQVLPLTTINYEGQRVTFDRAYLQDLIDAFHTNALDQTPFMLANEDNEHTMDPERYRGDVVELSMEQDGEEPGLYATIRFADKASAQAVMANPKLGVSARIKEAVKRVDGKRFRRVLVHVLGTLDPKIVNMSAWKEVALSGYDSRRTVLDLTSAKYTKETDVAKNKGKGGQQSSDVAVLDIPNLSDDELRDFIASATEELIVRDPAGDDTHDVDDDTSGGPEDDILDADDDADDEDDAGGDDDTDDQGGDPASGGAELSNAARREIDLANAAAQAAHANAMAALQQLADERWTTESTALVKAGVPKAIVDLAEPFLHRAEPQVMDLSNGKKIDASARMRRILESLVGYIELSNERGHVLEPDADSGGALSDKDKTALDAWRSQYPA